MKVHILCDSSTDVAESYRKEITRIPLTVRFGQEEYFDEITLDRETFYEKLACAQELPTTSQATPGQFHQYFREIAEQGDSAVVITLSSSFSGTYQSACIAAEEYAHIYVVDSQSVAIGAGVLAQYAVECSRKGMSAEEIVRELEAKRRDTHVIALLDTLEYLKKGGRISKTVALAGGMLNIKPVVTVQDGAVALIGKARGSKNGNNLLVEKIQACGGVDFTKPVLLGYTGTSSALLDQYVRDSHALWEDAVDQLPRQLISGVIGTHVGPGAVAVAFFGKKQ